MDDIASHDPDFQHPLKDIPIEVTVAVGHASPTVKELLSLNNNSVLTLDRRVDDPVELFVGDRLIARGILEEVAGPHGANSLAVRLTEVVQAQMDQAS